MATASAPAQSSSPQLSVVPQTKKFGKLTLWPLVAATFFMVSGGTYGTEDIVHGAGYGRAILILLLTPILWSLPTAFMIGELSSTLPEEGGYYAWVRRAMGNFWGFQEAWLSLVASVFDMAIYPTLFILYLERLFPWFAEGRRGLMVGLAVVAVCALLNIAGVKVVSTTSLWLFFALSAPFVAIICIAPFKFGALATAVTKPTNSSIDILTGVLICMWNYMGWDNASTIAAEVEKPQRTYPRAMLAAVVIVALSYIVPVGAMWMTGLASGAWDTGFWADAAGLMGGPLLRVGLALGGMISGFGMFNALVMSYSRLPLAMAQDGMLPKIFAKRTKGARAPWVAIMVLAILWAPCLLLGFERLVTIDILLYGASLALEFAALVCLRIREPELPRPFRVPGGLWGAMAIGITPMLMLGFSIFRSQHETVAGMSSFAFGILLMVAGVVAYALNHALKPEGWAAAREKPQTA
ncbi:MAG TPA: APC family permease [Terriglobales bacterium]|nr:APC family permease [Terriglobales bacterium]